MKVSIFQGLGCICGVFEERFRRSDAAVLDQSVPRVTAIRSEPPRAGVRVGEKWKESSLTESTSVREYDTAAAYSLQQYPP